MSITDTAMIVRSIASHLGMRLTRRCGMCVSLRAAQSAGKGAKGVMNIFTYGYVVTPFWVFSTACLNRNLLAN